MPVRLERAAALTRAPLASPQILRATRRTISAIRQACFAPGVLVLRARNRFGEAFIESTLAIERTFSALYIHRSGLTFDVRFVPPSGGRSERVHLFVMCQGEFSFRAPSTARFVGPSAFILSEDAFEGAEGRRTTTFRSHGSPFVLLDLLFHRDLLARPFETGPLRLDVGDRVAERASELLGIGTEDSAVWGGKLRVILEELASEGVVRPELARSIRESDRRFARLWSGLTPVANRFFALTTLDEISETSRLSLRQVGREMSAFLQAFQFGVGGWRNEMRRLRFKIAQLGLSAEGATVADVARATGYGSTEAMARAFREAGLPSPSAVRAALRGPEAAL